MEFHFVMVLFLTSVALRITSAIVPQELYWQSVLPTTPMPTILHDLLPSDQKSKQATDVGDGSLVDDPEISDILNGGGPLFYYKSDKNDQAISDILNGGGPLFYYKSDKNDQAISDILNGGGPLFYYKSDKNDPAIFDILNGGGPLFYYKSDKNNPATSGNLNGRGMLQYKPNKEEVIFKNLTLFFLGKDLRTGKKMNLYLARSPAKSKFLPRQVAEKIPISLETVDKFARPNSRKSKLWKSTVELCKKRSSFKEEEGEGEYLYCATSLEALVDFITSKLGKNIQAFSTESDKGQKQYTINQDVRMLGTNKKMVTCHRQVYPYPVFVCHGQPKTKAYEVQLTGEDGSRQVKAIVMCHGDTFNWNPDHIAFHLLKVKPGTGPICHVLPSDHISFIAN